VRTTLSLPLFSRVRLVGSTSVGALDATGEVVRLSQQVDRPGFGLRFEVLPAAQRGVLEQLHRAKSGETSQDGDPRAEAQLRAFEARQGHALYEQLGVSRDAPTRRIRDVCERLAEELSPHHFESLSPGQKTRLEALRLRVAEAEEVLIDPARRALYDAINGNVLGVLRCITEGLTLEALGDLREDFLKVRPDAETKARPAVERSEQLVERGDLAGGLSALADALCDDPLNLRLHQKAVELRSGLTGRPA
jgi:serine/threonine-protein kinase